MAKLFKFTRHLFEFLVTCCAILFIPLLPRRAVLSFAKFLTNTAWRFSKRDREVALANLKLAFPEMAEEEREKIARRSFEIFALNLCDFFWFGLMKRKRFEKWVAFDVNLAGAIEHSPTVYLTAHFGNWEIMGQKVAMRTPLTSVAAVMENPLIDKFVYRFRTSIGQTIVQRRGALKSLVKALKKNENVALVTDQNTLPEEGGVFVPLFGVPAPISKAGPALARRTSAPVVFGYCLVGEGGRYKACSLPPVKLDNCESDEEATAEVARMLERIIRDNPDHWLWSYKRWKFIPEGADSSGFPYYARAYIPK